MAEYCRDYFKMVDDTDDSFRMWQGLVGPHYTPSVSNDGTLSWSNDGNLPNPSPVNLRGPQGAGIRIAGIAETEAGLPSVGAEGAIWLVGSGTPYEGWSYVGSEWIDLGPLSVGPPGPPGPQGDDYSLTEADKLEIAQISESLLLTLLDSTPLGVRYGGTGARDVEGAQEMLGISEILEKLGTWPLGTDAQDVAGAVNEMIGKIGQQTETIDSLNADVAGEFSPTRTYALGTYVLYGGLLYRCTVPVTTAGAWTGNANWTQVTVGGELTAHKVLYFTNQAVTARVTAGQLMRIPASGTNSAITTDTVVLECTFANPAAITSDVTWTSYSGYILFSGTSSTATTANVTLGRKGN